MAGRDPRPHNRGPMRPGATPGGPRSHASPKRSLGTLAALLAVLLLSLGVWLLARSLQGPRPGSGVPWTSVEVDAGAVVGDWETRLGTQFVYPGNLAAPEARSAWRLLAPGLVRINATTDGCCWAGGPPPAIPQGVQRNSWDFSSLDDMIHDAIGVGAQVDLDVTYAPNWMWDCSRRPGVLKDPSFQTFARYMAQLVSYYNRGTMTADDGRVYVNPDGTRDRIAYWEVWNEPDAIGLGCPQGSAPLSPEQYRLMWNAVAPAMTAVDPSIQVLGPATSNAVTGASPDYLPSLMRGTARPPDIVSFHGYGGWDNAQPDAFLFDGDPSRSYGSCCGLHGIDAGLRQVMGWAPGKPIWITEINVNAAHANDPSHRPWTAFGAAWFGDAFVVLGTTAARAHTPLTLVQYQFDHPDGGQFNLVDRDSGAKLLSFWTQYDLARSFPPGSVLLRSSSSRAGVVALAVRPPGSRDVDVLVVDRQVDGSGVVGGRGVPASVKVRLRGVRSGGTASLLAIDRLTPPARGPSTTRPPVTGSKGDGLEVDVRLPGYGLAVLRYAPPA
jgi:hypothetical protein